MVQKQQTENKKEKGKTVPSKLLSEVKMIVK